MFTFRNLAAATTDESDFFATRQELLHATMDECAYNSRYAYLLREDEYSHKNNSDLKNQFAALTIEIEALMNTEISLKSKVTDLTDAMNALRERNTALEKVLSNLRDSKTWKLAAPLWRLETHGTRKAARRKRSMK